MTDIQVFDFGGRKVRTAGTHDAPLFCGVDVYSVLGLSASGKDTALAGLVFGAKALQMPIMVPVLTERRTEENVGQLS